MSTLKETSNLFIKYSEIFVKKTEDIIKLAKINLEIKKISNQLNTLKQEIGELVFKQLTSNQTTLDLSQKQIQDNYQQYNELVNKLNTKKEEKNKIKRKK